VVSLAGPTHLLVLVAHHRHGLLVAQDAAALAPLLATRIQLTGERLHQPPLSLAMCASGPLQHGRLRGIADLASLSSPPACPARAPQSRPLGRPGDGRPCPASGRSGAAPPPRPASSQIVRPKGSRMHLKGASRSDRRVEVASGRVSVEEKSARVQARHMDRSTRVPTPGGPSCLTVASLTAARSGTREKLMKGWIRLRSPAKS
jgi:hypothetical protein